MGTEAKVDRRIARTKEAIVKAFLALFSEKDFQHITINEIAERANVNRGTIYLHYIDKYDLLDKCIEEHLHELIRFCRPNGPDRGTFVLTGELKPVFDYFEDHYRFFSDLFANERVSVFRERLLDYVSASVRKKLDAQIDAPGTDNELNAQFMASAFVGIVEWWIRRGMPHPPQYMAEQLWSLFKRNEIDLNHEA